MSPGFDVPALLILPLGLLQRRDGRRNTNAPAAGCPANGSSYSARRDLASHSSCSFIYVRLNGHPARQDELTGTEKGTNVVFLHTTVDNGDHFQQILAWTLKSQWQKQDQSMREVTESFRSEK